MALRVQRPGWVLALGLALLVLLAPAYGLALSPVQNVMIDVQVEGAAVTVTEQRVLADPRAVEFLEFIVPAGATFEVVSISDSAGPYERSTAASLPARAFRTESGGQVAYIEWHDPQPKAPNTVVLTYRVTGGLLVHKDGAVEWYWPALTGSGGRGVTRATVNVHLAAPGQAWLYAYGGEAGAARVVGGNGSVMRVDAVKVGEDRTLELRLLAPAQTIPGAAGQPGPSDLAALRQREDKRIASEMFRAQRKYAAHWLLTLAPFVLAVVYWRSVRRHQPDPRPSELSTAELMAVSPAAVGWTYDSAWFDFGTAQLLHLERQGALRYEEGAFSRAVGPTLSEADEALLQVFQIPLAGAMPIERMSNIWAKDIVSHHERLNTWLKRVEAAVPLEWLDRPSYLWGGVPAAIYAVGALLFAGWLEFFGLLAVAALLGVMVWKRRFLSALGEAYVARWVQIYWAAVSNNRKAPPDVTPEYLLAVEVGDEHLERAMGKERYRVVRTLYEHLEP